MPIRTLLVDDSHQFMEILRRFVQTYPKVLIAGEASSGQEALIKARELRPDLVILDVGLPDMNGFALARLILTDPHPPKVVFLSFNDGAEYREAAAALGALAFVSKAECATQMGAILDGLLCDAPRSI